MKKNSILKLITLFLVVAVFFTFAATLAYFTDRVDNNISVSVSSFSKDGYTITRQYNDILYIANDDIDVKITESNDKDITVYSVVTMSVEWVSPDPTRSPFGNADAADNAIITIDGKQINYTVNNDGTITFDLPSHELAADSTNERTLKFHIPESLDSTGYLNFTFDSVSISSSEDGGFINEYSREDLNASEQLDFDARVVWDFSPTTGDKKLISYLENTDTEGEYRIVVEKISGNGDMHDWPDESSSHHSVYKDSTVELELNEGITAFGDNVFHDFTKITELTLPESTVSIRDSAFDNISIPSLTIPENAREFGELAFGHINELTVITFNTPEGVDLTLPTPGAGTGAFYVDPYVPTKILGLNEDAQNYDWITDQRRVIPILRSYTYTWDNNAVEPYVGGYVAEQADFHADAYRNTVKTAVFADANTYYQANNFAAISAMRAAGTDTYTSGNTTYWNVTDPDHAAANPNAAYSVIAALDSTTGELIIMGDGGKVYANEDSNFLFSLFLNLTSIDAGKYNTSLAMSMHAWHFFNDPPRPEPGEPDMEQIQIAETGAKQILGTETWDMSNVVDTSDMFHNAINLVSLDVSTWNTESLVYANGTFKGMSKITSLDVSEWDMADVITIESMFSRCESLTSLPVENWDVSKVQDMEMTFSSVGPCALDLSKWNTSSLTDLYQTFMNARITSLNVTGWDTSKVTNMQGAFQGTTGLKTLDLSTWDTSNVGNGGPYGGGSMYNMFSGSSVETLNLTGFDFSYCADINFFCRDCKNLKNIIGEETWTNTATWTSLGYVFQNCESLESLDVANWDVRNVKGYYYGFKSAFEGCKKLKTLAVDNWDVSQSETFDSMFSRCESLTSINISKWNIVYDSLGDMFNGCRSLTTLTFPASVNYLEIGMCANCPKLEEVIFLSTASTWDHTVTPGYSSDISVGAFYLTPEDAAARYPSTGKVPINVITYGDGMAQFAAGGYGFGLDNRALAATAGLAMLAPMDNWYRGSITRNTVTSITISDSTVPANPTETWDASVNQDGSVMAYLVGTDLYIVGNGSGKIYANPISRSAFGSSSFSSWQYGAVSAFNGLSLLDTSKALDMGYLFYGMSKVTDLDVSNFDTSNVTFATNMFNSCSNVESLDLSGFDTQKMSNMANMFSGMRKLQEVKLGPNFSFTGAGSTSCTLPTPSSTYITGADGNWYSSAGLVYAPANVPSGVADTYVAIDNRVFVTLKYMDDYTADEEYHHTGTLPTPTRTGYKFLGWYEGIDQSTKVAINSFTNPGTDYAWTRDAEGVWSSGNAGVSSTSSKMLSEEFTIPEGGGLVSFEWRSNGEKNYDYLGYDIYNVTTGKYLSGKTTPSYSNCIANLKGQASSSFEKITYELEAGTYQILFMYGKDSSGDNNEDKGFVRNVYWSDPQTWAYGNAYSGTASSGMVFMAKWELTGKLVTLMFNDGVTANRVIGAHTSSDLPIPSRTGYTFGGWYVADYVQSSKNITSFTNPNSNYAWTQDANGVWSSSNAGVHSSTSSMLSEQFTIIGNGTVSFEWRSNGEAKYDYLGYDIYNVNTGKYLSGQTTPTYKDNISDLYDSASTEFTKVEYTLTDGTYQILFMYGKDSSSSDEEDKGFVKNVVVEYEGAVATSDLVPSTISEDICVLAAWTVNSYTIAFDGNGATEGSVSSISAVCDKDYTLPIGGFTRTDAYCFMSGWNTKADGSGTTYGKGTTVSNLTTVDNATVTLYAQWVIPETPTLDSQSYWYEGTLSRSKVTKVTLQTTGYPSAYDECWDASADDDGSIMAFLTGTELVVVGNGSSRIYTNQNAYNAFSFENATAIENLNILNTTKTTSFNNMFSYCEELTSLDLSSFDTSNGTTFNYMFRGCSSLTELDLSKFNTGIATSMNYMFRTCTDLATIYVSDLWSVSNVTSSTSMFDGCKALVGGANTAYDSTKVDATYAIIDGGTSAPGYLTSITDKNSD